MRKGEKIMNTPKLFIDGDTIILESFDNITLDQKICIKIFNFCKVIISIPVPDDDCLLDCHHIITLINYRYQSQELVEKLIAAGVSSGTHFINCNNFYIASLI